MFTVHLGHLILAGAPPAGALGAAAPPAAPAFALRVIPVWHLGHLILSGRLGFFTVMFTAHLGHFILAGAPPAGALGAAGAVPGLAAPGAAPAFAFSVMPAWHLGHLTLSGLFGFLTVMVTAHLGHLIRAGAPAAGAFGAARDGAGPALGLAGPGAPPAGPFSVMPAWHFGHLTFSGLFGFLTVIVTAHLGHLILAGPPAAGAFGAAGAPLLMAPGAPPAGPFSVMPA